jgi:D-3-phosphoglycerate dehydrogenase / 2-oxoglutarate reductase
MNKPLVLITDCDHPDTRAEHDIFGAAGLEVRLANCTSEADVLAAAASAEAEPGPVALLSQYAPITSRVVDGLALCCVVGRYGAGLDTIDVPAARARGWDIISVPDYSVQEVSDHAMALALALCRGVVAFDRSVHSGHWDIRETAVLRRLSSLRFGVVGLGQVGRAVARKAVAFDFEVVGYDVAAPPEATVPLVSLEVLLSTCDVVSLHVPLMAETRHLIDSARLALMRPTAVLVNTSRGAVVDQSALVKALREGRLAGAGLDVLEHEPPPVTDPVLSEGRVIITPHVAFYSEESLAELKRRVAEGIVEALRRRGLVTATGAPGRARGGVDRVSRQ